MRRADIARNSAVTGGADYISTLPDQKARGRRVVMSIDLLVRAEEHHIGLTASVVTGSLRKFVSELVQHVRLDESCEPARSGHRNAHSVVGLVAVERSIDPPLLAEESKYRSLTRLVVLLRVQIHRISRAAAIVHEPHRQSELVELELWDPLPTCPVEQLVVRSQLRKRASDESVRDSRPVAKSSLRWCSYQLREMSIFPVDIASLVRRMVDLEKRVGLAAHCTVAEQ
jgi:hypothetical protein